ncbi:MAG: T9SS type A sorting domain-containing protein [Paludibacteraceae bacterium]
MFEYIRIEGLDISSYDSNGAVLTDGTNTIPLHITLNQSTFPVGTKVNIKVILSSDGTNPVLVGNVSNIEAAPLAGVDPFSYPTRTIGGKSYTLTNNWLISSKLDNLAANQIHSASQMVRGMIAKDGKMYFIDSQLEQLTIVDGATGKKLTPIKLPAATFATCERPVGGLYPLNDLKQDKAGHVLLSNGVTSNKKPFEIWKVDIATGSTTLILSEALSGNPDFAEATVRFDAFGVYGDVNTNAIIMASNASAMEAYKWTITNGVAGTAEVVLIDATTAGTYLTGLTNPGSAPQIFPLDENYFYLDGQATYPTLIDMDGNVLDGFYNNTAVLIDEITNPGTTMTMNVGHNGLIEFELGGDYFFLIAATNTLGTPASSFRLFKWANANKEFSGLEAMWTFPAAGMGAMSNPYRTAVPSVKVDEAAGIAKLYLYTGENGYGVYEFGKLSTGLKDNYNNDAVKVTLAGKTLNLSEEVANVTVYSITGQLVAKADKVSSINVSTSGVLLVKATTYKGETALHKVIIK